MFYNVQKNSKTSENAPSKTIEKGSKTGENVKKLSKFQIFTEISDFRSNSRFLLKTFKFFPRPPNPKTSAAAAAAAASAAAAAPALAVATP